MATIVKGTVIGAGIGLTAGTFLHYMASKKSGKATDAPSPYEYLEKNAELKFHTTEILFCKSLDHKDAKDAYECVCDGLDRLLALEELSNGPVSEVDVGWPVTAQHYSGEVSDALELLKGIITTLYPSQLPVFKIHVEAIRTNLTNMTYNISMQIQAKMNP